METKQVLQGAQNLIRDPAHWCKDTNARNIEGKPVLATSPNAVSFCVYGAVENVIGSHLSSDISRLLSEAAIELDFQCGGAGEFNDKHSHKDVMRLFDAAIAKC